MPLLPEVIRPNLGTLTAVHMDNSGILQFAVNHEANLPFQTVNNSHHFFPLDQRQQQCHVGDHRQTRKQSLNRESTISTSCLISLTHETACSDNFPVSRNAANGSTSLVLSCCVTNTVSQLIKPWATLSCSWKYSTAQTMPNAKSTLSRKVTIYRPRRLVATTAMFPLCPFPTLG